MNLSDLSQYCKDMIKNHPELKDKIIEQYVMAKGEIEDGESEENECELAHSAIQDLINP